MANDSITTCNEKVYPKGQWGFYHGSTCGRPGKEDGKCGIHCKSAKDRRQKVDNEKYKARVAEQKANDIKNAIYLLEHNGYEVTKCQKQ